MRYRVSVKGWGNTLTTAHLTLEEAEARIAESIRINSESFETYGGSTPRTDDDYVITEVDEPSRPCVHCGGEIVCDSDPETNFCRMCWATGRHDTDVHADECKRLSGILGQEVTVWQTGGGCMAYGVTLKYDGEEAEVLIGSEASVDEDPDEPVWGYQVERYPEGSDAWGSCQSYYDEGELSLWEAADRARKVASMSRAEFDELCSTQV